MKVIIDIDNTLSIATDRFKMAEKENGKTENKKETSLLERTVVKTTPEELLLRKHKKASRS